MPTMLHNGFPVCAVTQLKCSGYFLSWIHHLKALCLHGHDDEPYPVPVEYTRAWNIEYSLCCLAPDCYIFTIVIRTMFELVL